MSTSASESLKRQPDCQLSDSIIQSQIPTEDKDSRNQVEMSEQDPHYGGNVGEEDDAKPTHPGGFVRRSDRPVYKLSVKLIDTYKYINKIYYANKAAQLASKGSSSHHNTEAVLTGRGGPNNDGYDDSNYDYIIMNGADVIADRYIIKQRLGKGSFGQVVAAYDPQTKRDVAIKIIKSKKPFLIQAQTEIGLLQLVDEKQVDENGMEADYNCITLLDKFVFRNHQCLVFEMMSFNLYELLKQTS